MYSKGYAAGSSAARSGKAKNEVPIARNPDWLRGFHEGYDANAPKQGSTMSRLGALGPCCLDCGAAPHEGPCRPDPAPRTGQATDGA